MDKTTYTEIEAYMLSCIEDSAHDKFHIYRVLYLALEIASNEAVVNMDVLIAACLLHDIGRGEEHKNPTLCHAKVGGEMAYGFLVGKGWSIETARHVQDCVTTHRFRFRDDSLPKTIEARILFDSDKLDVMGSIGMARTLLYAGQILEPLYCVDQAENVLDGSENDGRSFFHEYHFKLKNLYDRLYTQRGREIAKERQKSATAFYESLLGEIKACHEIGMKRIKNTLL